VEAKPRTLENYLDANGDDPFNDWLTRLKDRAGRAKIDVRLHRVQQGNFGDYRHISDGVQELRINFGPGYRVYYGIDGDSIILLCGGDKSTQQNDIDKAIERWRDYCA
jgi:putative addiction module killer protein